MEKVPFSMEAERERRDVELPLVIPMDVNFLGISELGRLFQRGFTPRILGFVGFSNGAFGNTAGNGRELEAPLGIFGAQSRIRHFPGMR